MPSFARGHATSAAFEQDDAPVTVNGVAHFGVYVDGIQQALKPSHAVALDRVRGLGRGFVWLSLSNPDERDIRSAADIFGLHPLAVAHALHGRAHPKVEWFEGHLVIALNTLTGAESEPKVTDDGQIALFVGRDFLITCERGGHTAVDEVRRRVDGSPVSEPSAVMHAIIDLIVGDYLERAALIRTKADLVEEKVFSQSCDGDIETIYRLKREIIHVRRSIEPLTHALRQFAEEHGDLISRDLRHSMRDVMGQNVHAVERIASTDALLESLLESAYGRDSTQQNMDLRKISAWAAMGAVPTTVAGIYGMRFPDIPELHWAMGYPAVLTFMALVTGFLYLTFHRKHWL